MPNNQIKAEVTFSQIAWAKQLELVDKFKTEVQWHGTVTRTAKNTFRVDDILLFPHEVSAASVDSVQEEFEAWLDTLPNDIFLKNRIHGHSHVNFGITPSGKDEDVKRRLLGNLGKPRDNYDPFYIFIILNKRGEVNCQIHDITNDVHYKAHEVQVYFEQDEKITYDLGEFVKEAKQLATLVDGGIL